MEKAQKILMSVFVAGVVLVLSVAVAGELGWLPVAEKPGNSELEFVVLTVMELLTLAMIPLALKLFKFKKVKQEFAEKGALALVKWGLIRLNMLLLPMFLNALFYYLFVNNSFGLMAIILCVCLVFVYPSKKRCEAELEA